MNCRQCTALLSAYLDERVSSDQRAQLGEHVHGCADCARELQTMQRISTALAGDDGAPPAELAERLTRAALSAGREPEPSFIERWLRVAWPSAAATAAAAAALAFAMTSAAPTAGFDDGASDDPIAAIAGDDELDVAGEVLGMEEE